MPLPIKAKVRLCVQASHEPLPEQGLVRVDSLTVQLSEQRTGSPGLARCFRRLSVRGCAGMIHPATPAAPEAPTASAAPTSEGLGGGALAPWPQLQTPTTNRPPRDCQVDVRSVSHSTGACISCTTVRQLSRMLGFTMHPKDRVVPFFVLKSDKKSLRLVWDARAPNRRFRKPPSMSMGTASAWKRVPLGADSPRKLYVAKADVRNYFYALGNIPGLCEIFCLPEVPVWFAIERERAAGKDVEWLESLDPMELVSPMLLVVPMGWSWAFWIGQMVLEWQIQVATAATPTSFLRDLGPLPGMENDKVFFLPYVLPPLQRWTVTSARWLPSCAVLALRCMRKSMPRLSSPVSGRSLMAMQVWCAIDLRRVKIFG